MYSDNKSVIKQKLPFKMYCMEQNKWLFEGAKSGLYGGREKTSHPSSNNFWRVIKKTCGALSYHGGKHHPYDLIIPVAFLELHHLVW